MNELDLQKKIVDAYNLNGGFAFKCSNRFLIGVVDISQMSPGAPHCYNECKVVKHPVKSATVPLELTDKQRKFLRDYRKAGGVAIYTVFMKVGVGGKARWHWHIGQDLALDRLPVVTFVEAPRWTESSKILAAYEAFIGGMI